MNDVKDVTVVSWQTEVGFTVPPIQTNSWSSFENETKEIILNQLMRRSELFDKLIDPRRDIEAECGYPATTSEITLAKLKFLYDREPIAQRVVKMEPTECWKMTPKIYETEDEESTTPFEEAVRNLCIERDGLTSKYKSEEGTGSGVWGVLKRADILSGIGSFGVLLFGISDGKKLSEPAFELDWEEEPSMVQPVMEEHLDVTDTKLEKEDQDITDLFDEFLSVVIDSDKENEDDSKKSAKGKKRSSGKKPTVQLKYLRAFDESLVQISRYDNNKKSPRYGMAITYTITLNDYREGLEQGGAGADMTSVDVHWTRIQHIADNKDSSEVFGVSRMRPVLNRLLDLYKLYGGSAEMYWQGAFPGISIETLPQLGPNVKLDMANIRTQMANWQNHLQRWMAMAGTTAKTLAPQVVDPTPQITVQIEAICIVKGYPKRIFMGSERGELASSQDSESWDERVEERRNSYLTPELIVPFIDRLIQMGVLPEPESFGVSWESPDKTSKKEAAETAKTIVEAIVAYMTSDADMLISPLDLLVKVIGFSNEEAKNILDAAEKHMEEKMDNEMDMRMSMLDNPLLDEANPEGGPPVLDPDENPIPPVEKKNNLPGARPTTPPDRENQTSRSI